MLENRFSHLGKFGFNNEAYVKAQSDAIIERASKFDKLYLEFGGKLLYDYHAAKVLPGYRMDAKMNVIKRLAHKRPIEFLFCVSARDLQSGKKMGALGISYWDFSLKMLDSIKAYGFKVPNVVINLFSGEPAAKEFGAFMRKQGYDVYYRDLISGYPNNLKAIASSRGFGKKPFIRTEKSIVIVTGAGPNSGKMATCLTMVYQDYLKGDDSGYAKFESFPVWNLPLESPINAAYEAATADIGDYNLIDPYHLKAYKVSAVNYNRDVASFAIISNIIKKIISPGNFMHSYHSPTDMGLNFVSRGIVDLELCERAARQEIIRRYFGYRADFLAGTGTEDASLRVEKLMKRQGIRLDERPVVALARDAAKRAPGHRGLSIGCALMLPNGETVSEHNSPLMHAESAAIISALKKLAFVHDRKHVLWGEAVSQVRKLRRKIYSENSENLNVPEILIALAVSAAGDENAAKAFAKLEALQSSELHTTHMLSPEDATALRRLGINCTSDGKKEFGKLYLG